MGRRRMKSILKTILLSIRKLPAMAGSLIALFAAIVATIPMFLTAYYALNATIPTSFRIAYLDSDGSAISNKLVTLIEKANGSSLELIECASFEDALRLCESNEVEGFLEICSDFEENLKKGRRALEYHPSEGASSAQAARELIAGEAVKLGSRLRSEDYFSSVTGAAPNDSEKRELFEIFASQLSSDDSAVEKETVFRGGSTVEKPREMNALSAFYARYSGFTSFVIMLLLLMLGAFCGSRDEQHILERISSIKHGRALGFFSTLIALMLFGLLLLIISFIPAGKANGLQIASGVSYVFCAASLSILLGSLSGTARAELASPLIAFLTSLAGGCFTDPSALGPSFQTLARSTPQGQYLAALNGEKLFIPIMLAVGTMLLLLSMLLSNAAKKAVQAR